MKSHRNIMIWITVVLSTIGAQHGSLIGEEARADDPSQMAAHTRFFETRIRPILATRCVRCHGPEKQESGLRLDSRKWLLEGGESGPAVTVGDPDESLLVEAIRYESFEMPPDGQLDDPVIADFVAWIQDGLFWPADQPIRAVEAARKIAEEDRRHWAFQPVADPPLPTVQDGAWCRTGVDHFILQRLEQIGAQPAREADAPSLVRRLYFDLIGLPPTPEEMDAYLADDHPDKYERLVDRLLSDPRYGEKWGRHWLDVVRFAEGDGWRQDAFRPEAYRYRDYVIESFNADRPFDQFIRQQIAGDELEPGNPDAISATAFLRHGIYEYNQRDVETQWDNIINEITDVTGDAFLGLSLGCARCHDHKFDPILQKDYFALRAFFEPLLWREDQPVATVEVRQRYEQGLAKWAEATEAIRAELDALEWPALLRSAGGQGFEKFAPHLKEMMLRSPQDRTPREEQIARLALRQLDFDRKKMTGRFSEEEKKRWQQLRDELAERDKLKPKALPTRKFAVSDVGPVAPPTYIPGHEDAGPIGPGFLSVLESHPPRITPPAAVLRSTGRRSALATWIAGADNPLTARVLVNRVWQYHFGTGIVATADNFGRAGEPPSHPELLDWLASRFIKSGWSVKAVHRLVLLSSTYRQTAFRQPPPELVAADPDNRLLWKMTSRRLDAEQIRDALLAVSGDLDGTMGGPSVSDTAPRRSIYVKFLRNRGIPFLSTFDMADGLRSTARRNVTTTPLQALTLINGPFALARAKAMAQRVLQARKDESERVEFAYQLAFARRADAAEIREAHEFLAHQKDLVEKMQDESDGESIDSQVSAWSDFCHVLLNANEFLYVD